MNRAAPHRGLGFRVVTRFSARCALSDDLSKSQQGLSRGFRVSPGQWETSSKESSLHAVPPPLAINAPTLSPTTAVRRDNCDMVVMVAVQDICPKNAQSTGSPFGQDPFS